MQFQLKYRGVSHQHFVPSVPTTLGKVVRYRGANYYWRKPINLTINSYNPILVYRGVAYQKHTNLETVNYSSNEHDLLVSSSLDLETNFN